VTTSSVNEALPFHKTQLYSEEAVGVNVQATAKNAGIKFTFPFEKTLSFRLAPH